MSDSTNSTRPYQVPRQRVAAMRRRIKRILRERRRHASFVAAWLGVFPLSVA